MPPSRASSSGRQPCAGTPPRQRLDLSVNILTNHAVNLGKITVFGGSQLRPNLHIQDYCDAVQLFLTAPAEKIQNETFNVGYQNLSLMEIAELVRRVVSKEMPDEMSRRSRLLRKDQPPPLSPRSAMSFPRLC
jgi:nucleoside-diphosphate-sugar epimerase